MTTDTGTETNENILWTGDDAQAATGGDLSCPFLATGVSIDSRTLRPGDLFVALKGDNMDGHNFVEDAFRAGAAAALVDGSYTAKDPLQPILRVADTLTALEALAHAARARTQATVIGVTGSAGKTGTKEMLAVMLRALGKTHANKKSFNNHWGVPLSLAALPPDADYAVFEMGMNHTGEMAALTRMVRPQTVVITTIEPAHIEHFPTVEAIADAKAEIFLGMSEDGIAVLNADNPHFRRLHAAAEKRGLRKIYGFGEDETAQTRLVDCALHADSSKVTADILGERVKYRLGIPGKHIVMNSLGALTAVKAVHGALTEAVEALKSSEAVEGRGNRLHIPLEAGQPPVTVIDESYNANPASMQAAFRVFEMTPLPKGARRIAVLGDMLELGKDGPQIHAELANPLLRAKIDLLFCCGKLMDALYQSLPPDWRGGHADDSKALVPLVMDALKPGDAVLVKGSAGSKMGYIIHALQERAARQNNGQKDRRDAV
jgi:UDP-N-acetylmuramoyl-tripeptide--D-alanyl-D-alanine ligase